MPALPFWSALPAWYLKLRLLLTVVVLLCQLTVGAWFWLLHGG